MPLVAITKHITAKYLRLGMCNFAMTLVQVVNKLVPLADITKLVGQEVLSQAPRVGLALGPVTEWGMVSHSCNCVLSAAIMHP